MTIKLEHIYVIHNKTERINSFFTFGTFVGGTLILALNKKRVLYFLSNCQHGAVNLRVCDFGKK